MLAESPTLKAAVDTYQAEGRTGGPIDQLTETVRGELAKVQRVSGVPALERDRRAWPHRSSPSVPWPPTGPPAWSVEPHGWDDAEPVEAVIGSGPRVYLTTVVPLVLGDDVIGEFVLAAPLDDAYARDLAADAHTDVAVLLDGRIVAGIGARRAGPGAGRRGLPATGTITWTATSTSCAACRRSTTSRSTRGLG